MNNTIVGLDIGTTKVTAVVGEILDDEEINIIGVGTTPSYGLRHGVVTSIEDATQCIQKALDEAQRMADMAVDYVYIGVSGEHIHSRNNTALIEVGAGGNAVTRSDVERLLEIAKAVPVEPGFEIVHSMVREYRLDGQGNILDPVGMMGTKLEVSVHLVFGSTNAIRNLATCANNVNLDVAEVILQPLASAEAVLTADEKNLGVVLIDIGGGTTDVAVFRDGKLEHTHIVPVGGWNFSHDLAVILKISDQEAERMKLRYGCVNPKLVEKGLTVECVMVGSEERRIIPADHIAEIMAYRAQELVELALKNVVQNVGDLKQFGAGIVITGGGSQVRGLEQMFREESQVPVRVGRTRNVTGLVEKVSNPIYATAVGLILFGYRHHEQAGGPKGNESLFDRAIAWIKGWFVGA